MTHLTAAQFGHQIMSTKASIGEPSAAARKRIVIQRSSARVLSFWSVKSANLAKMNKPERMKLNNVQIEWTRQ